MNATSLFVSTSKLVLKADPNDPASWQDLYRLVPYLRQSLSCSVCGNLLMEPFTPDPEKSHCTHHVCRACVGGRKNLKPSCGWCKDYGLYIENATLRMLLQCYKQTCQYIISSGIYKKMVSSVSNVATSSLAELIHEGAHFKDDYKSSGGLSKSDLSILPCIYTTTVSHSQNAVTNPEPPSGTSTGGTGGIKTNRTVYSRPENGVSKSTVRRKTNSDQTTQKSNGFGSDPSHSPLNHKKIAQRSNANKRKGCRCGNATATPGKLTCCGQRCPCYVESKACIECKCRGCRNPHRPDGQKIRPLIPELDSYQLMTSSPIPSMSFEDSTLASLDGTNPFPSVDSSDLAENTLPLFEVYPTPLQPLQTPLFVPDDLGFSESSSDDISDIDIGIDI